MFKVDSDVTYMVDYRVVRFGEDLRLNRDEILIKAESHGSLRDGNDGCRFIILAKKRELQREL
jgi:hypothetical protein